MISEVETNSLVHDDAVKKQHVYLLFAREVGPLVKAKYPTVQKIQFNQILGRIWSEMPKVERDRYHERAEIELLQEKLASFKAEEGLTDQVPNESPINTSSSDKPESYIEHINNTEKVKLEKSALVVSSRNNENTTANLVNDEVKVTELMKQYPMFPVYFKNMHSTLKRIYDDKTEKELKLKAFSMFQEMLLSEGGESKGKSKRQPKTYNKSKQLKLTALSDSNKRKTEDKLPSTPVIINSSLDGKVNSDQNISENPNLTAEESIKKDETSEAMTRTNKCDAPTGIEVNSDEQTENMLFREEDVDNDPLATSSCSVESITTEIDNSSKSTLNDSAMKECQEDMSSTGNNLQNDNYTSEPCQSDNLQKLQANDSDEDCAGKDLNLVKSETTDLTADVNANPDVIKDGAQVVIHNLEFTIKSEVTESDQREFVGNKIVNEKDDQAKKTNDGPVHDSGDEVELEDEVEDLLGTSDLLQESLPLSENVANNCSEDVSKETENAKIDYIEKSSVEKNLNKLISEIVCNKTADSEVLAKIVKITRSSLTSSNNNVYRRSKKYSQYLSVENDLQLYCVCRSSYSDDLIGCDFCIEWYHPKCLNFNEDQYQKILVSPNWSCPKCEKLSMASNHTTSKSVEKILDKNKVKSPKKSNCSSCCILMKEIKRRGDLIESMAKRIKLLESRPI